MTNRETPLTLGDLIANLEQYDPRLNVRFDFGHFSVPSRYGSYRGRYSDLAIIPKNVMLWSQCPTNEQVLQELRNNIGNTHTGWKGGEFETNIYTHLWVANPGEVTDLGVDDVINADYEIIIATYYFGY